MNWFFLLIDETSKTWMAPYFTEETFEGPYKLYLKIKSNWERIKKEKIPEDFQYLIAYILMMYNETDKLEKLYQEYKSLEILANLLLALAHEGKIIEIKSLIAEVTSSKIEQAIPYARIIFYLNTARINSLIFQYDAAIDKLKYAKQEIDSIKKEYPDKIVQKLKASYLNASGHVEYNYRKNEIAIKNYFASIKLLKVNRINNPFMLATFYNALGNCYLFKGSLNTAEKYYQNAYDLFKEEKIARGIAITEANMATIRIKLGKFDEALKKLEDVKTQLSKKKEPRNIALLNNEIMNCFKSLGKRKEAEKYLYENIALIKQNLVVSDEVFLSVVEFLSLLHKTDMAKDILEMYRMQILKDKESLGFHNAAYNIYNGIIELELRNYYDAEKSLRKGVNTSLKIDNIPLLLQGLKYLISLLFKKYQLTTNLEQRNTILDEIESRCEETTILLRNHMNIFLRINFQRFLAKIYSLRYKTKLSEHVLELTSNLCKDYGLKNLCKDIDKDIKQIQKTENREKRNISSKRRKELIELTESFKSIGTIDNYSTELKSYDTQKLERLLIIHPSGLPVYSYNFKATQEEESKRILVSGLINAIQSFSNGLMQKEGRYRMIEHEEYIIMLEKRDDFTIALFSEQFSYLLKEKMLKFTERALAEIKKEKLFSRDYVKADMFNSIKAKLNNIVKQTLLNP